MLEPGLCSALLTAVGLDVEDDQKNGRDQHEQQAGHETEIVGFHQGMEDSADRITIAQPLRKPFIRRCGRGLPFLRLSGRFHHRPAGGPLRQELLMGLRKPPVAVLQSHLGARDHNH